MEIKDFSGRSLPELEANRLTVHTIITIDGHEDLGCIGDIVKGDIFFTDTLIVIERIDDIIRIGIINRFVEQYLCADRHIERILAFIHTVVGRSCLYLVFDTKRFAQSVFIGQIDHIRIKTYGYIGIKGKRQRYLIRRAYRTARSIDREPLRHRLDGILVTFTGVVDDMNATCNSHVFSKDSSCGYLFLRPFDSIAIDEGGPCHRRNHRVTVQILHITYGDIDRLFVDFAILHIEVDEQLVVIERPVEVHLSELTDILYRGRLVHIAHIHHISTVGYAEYEWCTGFFRLSILLDDTLVVDGEDLLKDTVVVLLCLSEWQISQ